MKHMRLDGAIQRHLLVLAVCLFCATPVLADGDRVAELERRVAELEAMVEALIDEREGAGAQAQATARQAEAAAAQARTEAQTARQEIVELGRKVDPVIAAAEEQADAPRFSYGGYVKSDLMVNSFSDGSVPGSSIGRDFFVPGTIPVGNGDGDTYLDWHARQSRFHFATNHELDNGANLRSYIELDFLLTPGGNERVSNSYTPRLRHAYVVYNNWLIGQTWNTFMDVATLPESADFIGPTGGTSFGREPMIRYTNGGFAIALENPETTVTPIGGGRLDVDDNQIPDLAARYTWRGEGWHFQLGGMLRQLAIDDEALGLDATETGWGVSLSGKAMLGRDDVRWMIHTGEGMGRHVGLNFANGAAITTDGDLEAIGTTGGFVAYRHWWNQKWRSNAVLSYMEVDNPVRFTGTGVNESNWSGQINLLYSPVPALTFGVEYLTAERELESGLDGSLNKFQFTTKYAF